MEMPKNCDKCRFAVDGLCVAMNPERTRNWRIEETTNWCPLKEYETTDRITLARAISDEGFDEVFKVALIDPLRQVNVKMDTYQLFEIAKMLKEGKNGK